MACRALALVLALSLTAECRLYTYSPTGASALRPLAPRRHRRQVTPARPVPVTPATRWMLPSTPDPFQPDPFFLPNQFDDLGNIDHSGLPTRQELGNPWGQATVEHSHHLYYTMTVYNKSHGNFDAFWTELGNVSTGQMWHPALSRDQNAELQFHFSVQEPTELKDSYRRAVNVPIKFIFPFYGVGTRNITIATGGFCYIGENTHSWLAATQYIAPLMANFDTSDAEGTIKYKEFVDRIVIEWHAVKLKDDPQYSFTFQTHLHANGTIWFVYKQIGKEVVAITDHHHPRKVGLSDAYLESPSQQHNKRVIHEYHRIEVDFDKVQNSSVIVFEPLDSCIQAKTCEECVAKEVPQNLDSTAPATTTVDPTAAREMCGWCVTKEGLSFCSDSDGKHRFNEAYHTQCFGNANLTQCPAPTQPPPATVAPPADTTTTTAPAASSTPGAASSSAAPATHTDKPSKPAVVPADAEAVQRGEDADADAASAGGGGVLVVVVLVVLALTVGAWVGYAYMNPTSPSGQCLIRVSARACKHTRTHAQYRPSRWRMPNSDVRYTASVHM